MILADTTILIDYFRSRNSDFSKKVDSLPIAICGPVKTEILHGTLTDALIAYIAIKYAVPLWTKDHHFKCIQAVYPELELYE